MRDRVYSPLAHLLTLTTIFPELWYWVVALCSASTLTVTVSLHPDLSIQGCCRNDSECFPSQSISIDTASTQSIQKQIGHA